MQTGQKAGSGFCASFPQVIDLLREGATQDVLMLCQPVLSPTMKALRRFRCYHFKKQALLGDYVCGSAAVSPLYCFSVLRDTSLVGVETFTVYQGNLKLIMLLLFLFILWYCCFLSFFSQLLFM